MTTSKATGEQRSGLPRWLQLDPRLLVILLLALGVRLLVWSAPLHEPANDEREYLTVAHDLLLGRGWSFYERYHWLRAPLYPLFLAASLALAGGDARLATLGSVVLSVANVALVYALSMVIWQRKGVALLAALLMALLLTQATFARLFMSETLFTFLFSAALLGLLQWSRMQAQAAEHPTFTASASSVAGTQAVAPGGWRRLVQPRAAALLISSGLLLGLAVLTRSLPLAFSPVIALWMLLQPGSGGSARPRVLLRRMVPVVLLLSVCGLTIAPWSLRNYLAYGRLISVETGLSYNLWAFNEPREDQATIFRTLEQIANPAERAEYATARGLDRLREDPAILVRKLWPNWIYLWRVKPIQDRFLQQTYYGDVPFGPFLAALIFDDLLYFVILLAAAAGLMLAPNRRAHALLAGWLVYGILSMLLTHGEARYRHFFFPVLIVYAAWALAAFLPALHKAIRRVQRTQLAALALIFLLAFTYLRHYPWSYARDGLAKSWLLFAGQQAATRGELERAQGLFQHAVREYDSADGYLLLGDMWRSAGQPELAAEFYQAAWARRPPYIAASARLGDLLRAEGDLVGAATAFRGRYAEPQQVLDWSWTNLNPRPASELQIGDGLDFGYINGLFPAESFGTTEARWSGARARLRVAIDPRGGILLLRIAAPRHNAMPVSFEVCHAGRCTSLQAVREWRIYRIIVPPNTADQPLELRSATFIGPDGRELGLLLDEVRFLTSPSG